MLSVPLRYNEGSIKESTRHGRNKGASRVYKLHNTTRLPPQKVVLNVTANKAQLIDLICDDIIEHKDSLSSEVHHKLVVTGKDTVPVEINKGLAIKRQDMSTWQEEADTLLVQQVASVGADTSLVVADDTDVFILLLHFCYEGDIARKVFMISPVKGRALIDINATVSKHHDIMPDLLSTHGLSGCDTVAPYHGIGKGCALKVLRSHQYSLSCLGEPTSHLDDVLRQATPFILACYGQSGCHSITEARQKVWTSKVARSTASAPKLCSLPPTNEAFKQNVARAHLQLAVWRYALQPNPPELDPTTHGWTLEGKSLVPTTVPDDVPLAPSDVLKLIKCNCTGSSPCKSQRCGCIKANLACSIFCACRAETGCCNEKTVQVRQTEEENDESEC